MRLCRFNDDRLGLLKGEEIVDVSSALEILPSRSWPFPKHDLLIEHLQEVRGRIAGLESAGQRHPIDAVNLRSPVANPSKIIGAPANYRAHIAEANADPAINVGAEIKTISHYGLFLKAATSLVGPGEGIMLGDRVRRHDYEGELAIVIGRTGKRISENDALEHVAGYAAALDMTVRGPEDRSLRKSLDSYSVLGPWLVTSDEIENPDVLDLELWVNGKSRQKSNTRDMIYSCRQLISYASQFYTLLPGDIIMTGTPEGVGSVDQGDVITVKVEKVGSMTVRVDRE